jgi:hypothetical protein
VRGNPQALFGKRPTEKDPNHGHLAGGPLHSAGRPGKPTGSNPGRAPRPDPTKNRYRDEHHLSRYDPATIEDLNLAA